MVVGVTILLREPCPDDIPSRVICSEPLADRPAHDRTDPLLEGPGQYGLLVPDRN